MLRASPELLAALEENKKPQYLLQVEEFFDSSEHPLFAANPTLPKPEDDGGAQALDDYDREEEEDNADEDDADAKRKKTLRHRKQVNYNEEEATVGVGSKRGAAGAEEERNRFANSSKRARFNYTQQQNSSNLSIHSQKGANLLHQAIHHTQDQMGAL